MTVTEVQQALLDLGYDPGPVDGVWGSQSRLACIRFQQDQGLPADGIPGPQTQAALQEALSGEQDEIPAPSPMPEVMQHAASLGYKVWGDPWRLWLFGIRSPNREAGRFDDALGACWTEGDGYWRCEWWPGTTDPGVEWLENPSRAAGTAILVADQYVDCWEIGLHQGKYEALRQVAPVKIYRDGDKDHILDLDPSTITEGIYGINIHAATRKVGGVSTVVGKWSAGCQVHSSEAGFHRMMELANMQVEQNGCNGFTYTLMDKWW